jgi:hypothetical protein
MRAARAAGDGPVLGALYSSSNVSGLSAGRKSIPGEAGEATRGALVLVPAGLKSIASLSATERGSVADRRGEVWPACGRKSSSSSYWTIADWRPSAIYSTTR